MGVGVGNERDHGLAQGVAQLFVVDEEKQLVLLDRAAQAAAKLVLTERSLRSILAPSKKLAGVQCAVAHEFVRRSHENCSCRTC